VKESESVEIFLVCVVTAVVVIIAKVFSIVVPMWSFVVIFELYSISWLVRIVRLDDISSSMKVSLCVLMVSFMVLLLGFL